MVYTLQKRFQARISQFMRSGKKQVIDSSADSKLSCAVTIGLLLVVILILGAAYFILFVPVGGWR